MTLLLAQAADVAAPSATAEVVLFWILAVIGIGAGIAMVTSRNVVHAALLLVVNFFAISGMYLALESSFLSIVQIIVYAGAIMILFLFVIMLLGVDRDDLLLTQGNRVQQGVAALAAIVLAGMLMTTFVGRFTTDASLCGDLAPAVTVVDPDVTRCVGLATVNAADENGSVGVVGARLFTRFTFPFEASALLLTVATIGALVLGRRHDDPVEEDEIALPVGHRLDDDPEIAPLAGAEVAASLGSQVGESASTDVAPDTAGTDGEVA